ncbi:unnamed protein product [Medioppia subpectinata]|uniref:Sulfatase N-terminal domain-containing protein n=1 Tax=Medioppia subpectinata TaxID=1979941 RepID=A0A7R9L5R1_9ACAR|nr:unnamed protein product [Medioppia subpectinata]CAG2115010.1 unnamed protein product [Medioppia subpectinata]
MIRYKKDNTCNNGDIGARSHYKYIYDFMRLMASRNERYFAYMSLNGWTKDSLNKIGFMDNSTHDFLHDLIVKDNNTLLDETLVIFFSDQGSDWSPINELYFKEVESRLPFLFMRLPKQLRDKYGSVFNTNTKQLITPFDIHATLVHILNGEANKTLPHGLSLLDQIPDNRDCKSASIPESKCIQTIGELELVIQLMRPFEGRIVTNRFAARFGPIHPYCHSIALSSITSSLNRGNSSIRQPFVSIMKEMFAFLVNSCVVINFGGSLK